MWIGNLMLVVLNLPLIGIWIRLLKCRIAFCIRRSSGVLLHWRVFAVEQPVRCGDHGGIRFPWFICSSNSNAEPAPLLGFILAR